MTCFLLAISFSFLAVVRAAQPGPFSPDKQPGPVPMTKLKAGVATVDITPPLGVRLAGYDDRTGPATGIHDSLHAAVVAFDDGAKIALIVTLDIVDISQADSDAIKATIEQQVRVPPDHVLINASHTHGSPAMESDATWRDEVVAKVLGAVRVALGRLRPVSVGYGEGVIDFNINRRISATDGKCIPGLNPDGVCDRRVKLLRIDASDALEPMAVLMHVTCHANVYRMDNTKVTADFPGIAKAFVERSFGGKTTALFLQGCAGDIRANLPSMGRGVYSNNTADFGRSGSDVDMTWCGWTLGAEAVKVAARLRVREQLRQRRTTFDIAAAADVLRVSADRGRLRAAAHQEKDIRDGRIDFPIQVLRIGDIYFVGLPGEPVVEYGLQIEQSMKDLGNVFVLGYMSADARYIPVAHMIKEGGYEVDNGVGSEASEQEILSGVRNLVARVRPPAR